jgi:multiple sugar transport system permease protein
MKQTMAAPVIRTRPIGQSSTARFSPWLFKILAVLVIATILIYILFPFYWMLKSSFQTNTEIVAVPPIWTPTSFSFAAYATVLNVIPLARYFFNSLIISLITAALAASVSSSAAYVLSRFNFPGRMIILFALLFSQLVPPITRVVPVYFLLRSLDLINTYQGLILAYITWSVPFAVLMLLGYFRNAYPLELEDAALIDGCDRFSVFWRIVLPIAIPGIIAVTTYAFILGWNDFLWASIITTRGSMKTLQVGLRDFIGEFGNVVGMNAFMAACVITTLPTVLLFRVVEKYMVQGITSGAMKG